MSSGMFTKGNAKNTVVDSSSINLIGRGTQLTGDIRSNGDFRIDGQHKGTISVKGKLVVGATGSIEGEIECQNADISGEIKGRMNITELLVLKSTARLTGDIVTGKIAIEPDAQFTGTCTMNGGVVKNIKAESAARSEPKAEAV
ncbi:MAG: polymer-forming cytoskeletal protein [Bacteroidetes bacterium]|jgi:cytoskeletal protein CcmA (bactofilin family)|nr:polymer-forming cytoskeletal protein [Bacteroidota bacterium]